MGNTVYLPTQRRETLGSDLGGLLGAAISSSMAQKAQAQRQKEAMEVMEGIRAAPNRAAAFEVLSNNSARFRTPADWSSALKLVDEMKPISEETPTPITAYSPSTGEPTHVFPTRKDMVTPGWFEGKGVTLTKPDMSDFYQPTMDPTSPAEAPNYQHVGKLPVGRRPAGALTPQEIDIAQKQRTEARQGRTEIRQDENARRTAERDEARDAERTAASERADRRLELSEKRFSGMIGSISDRIGEQDIQRGQATMRSVRSTFALVLGAKPLADGSYDFSGASENQKKQYTDLMDYVAAKVTANPKLLKDPTAVEKLSSEALRAVAPKTVAEREPETTPAPKPKGGVGALWDKVTGKKEEPAKPAAQGANADTKASILAAKAAAATVRGLQIPTAEKSAKLQAIRKRLKDAGINEDI